MGLYYNLPVFKSTYELLRRILILTQNFNRHYRFNIGDSLIDATFMLHTLIFRAYDQRTDFSLLQPAREQVEIIRLHIRLLRDQRQISIEQFTDLNELVESISKQVTAWQKAMKNAPGRNDVG
jgi:hypothetical protein